MDSQELKETWESFAKNHDFDSKQKLVEHYFNFVQNIARKLASKLAYKVTVEELASSGIDGLYKAIDSYDPETFGTKFETYGYIRVWGAMIDGIRNDDWVPRSVRLRQADIEKARSEMEASSGIKVSDEMLFAHLGIDPEDYNRNSHKYHAVGISSLDNCLEDGEENKKEFNSYLVAKNEPSPDANILRKEFLSKLVGKNFTALERNILYLYYYENYTMKEISDKLKVSESRISQVHHDVLKRLKTRVEVNPNYFSADIMDIMDEANTK